MIRNGEKSLKRIKFTRSIFPWLVFGFLFYGYNDSFQTVLFGSRMGGGIFVLLITFLGILCQVNKSKEIVIVRDGRTFWYAMAFFSIIGNQDLTKDTETRWLLPMIGILMLFILTKSYSWQDTFVKVVRSFTGIHAFFTVFFYYFRNLYLNYFIKVIPGAGTYVIEKFNDGCMPGITSHYSTNGIYLGMGFVFFAGSLITNNFKNKKQLYTEIAKTLFVLLALVLTSKRAHILFGILACFIIYYVFNSNKKSTRWFYIIISVVALGILVIIAAPFVPAISRMVDRFLHADGGEITNGRIWFWEFALEKFKESPFIGIGWGGFKHAFYQKIGTYSSMSDYVDAHNVYLQVLCEQGLVGEFLFMGGIISAYVKNWKLLKSVRLKKIQEIDNNKQQYLAISLGIQSFFIMYCLTGNCLYDCEFFFVYMMCCALTYGVNDYLRSLYERR